MNAIRQGGMSKAVTHDITQLPLNTNQTYGYLITRRACIPHPPAKRIYIYQLAVAAAGDFLNGFRVREAFQTSDSANKN